MRHFPTGLWHDGVIFFLITEDIAMAYYTDSFKHPTYVMMMIMVCGLQEFPMNLVRHWVQSGLLT